MIAAVATGTAGYIGGWLLSFGLLLTACGGRGPSCPQPRHAAAADSPSSRVVSCEVRK